MTSLSDPGKSYIQILPGELRCMCHNAALCALTGTGIRATDAEVGSPADPKFEALQHWRRELTQACGRDGTVPCIMYKGELSAMSWYVAAGKELPAVDVIKDNEAPSKRRMDYVLRGRFIPLPVEAGDFSPSFVKYHIK